jgi:hypothetical protein
MPDARCRERLELCLAVATGRAERNRLAPALAGVDWADLASGAERERVAPLVYQALKHEPAVPPDVLARLRDSHRGTAVRVAQMRKALASVLRVLDAASIRVLLLKGAALGCDVWTDIGLRPWSDVDLFVAPHDVERALRALASLGYERDVPEKPAGARFVPENEVPLVGPGSVILDLHWSLFDLSGYQSVVGPQFPWDRVRDVAIEGSPAWVLAPERQLLHLCGHLAVHHAGDELLWLNDVAELLARYRDRLDWDLVLAEARATALVLALQRTLAQTAGNLGAPVPPGVAERVRVLKPTTAEQHLVLPRLTDRSRSMAARLWADVGSVESWPERLRFARARLFPPAAYMRRRYGVSHPALLAVAYPYRWLTGLRKPGFGTEGGTS